MFYNGPVSVSYIYDESDLQAFVNHLWDKVVNPNRLAQRKSVNRPPKVRMFGCRPLSRFDFNGKPYSV